MTLRDQLSLNLQNYYEKAGIIPDERFACKYKDLCQDPKYELERGMQCHIGYHYGERTKVLVASLDCGGGGKGAIQERTKKVTADAYETKRNPHMRGTFDALSLFLGSKEPSELVHYMVMTNTCKCCKKKLTSQMGRDFFVRCGQYAVDEILLAQPEVILFQGKNAPLGCLDYLHSVDPVDAVDTVDAVGNAVPANVIEAYVRNYLRIFDYPGKLRCYAVLCIHPSARGRQYQRRAKFYKDILPLLATYIRKHPLH